MAEELRALFRIRGRNNRAFAAGYSDREFRTIVTAARTDVAAIRERLAAPVPEFDSEMIEALLRTGSVAVDGVPFLDRVTHRRRLAEQVFITRGDLIPLLALFVATTGWNVETIKELPSEHRVIEGVAVEVPILKRRRGPGRWHRTVTWEIGKAGQELRTPGGLYLLMHRLMAPARALLVEAPYWAMWSGAGRSGPDRVTNPFADSLNTETSNGEWAAKHCLRADSAPHHDAPSPDTQQLSLNFGRLKKSVDVRRTRALGGHLPSAARSNTVPVLFSNYLAGDPTTIDWAQSIMSDAVADAERSAWSAHERALESMGRQRLDVRPSAEGKSDAAVRSTAPEATAWTSCLDHAHHPLTGRRCSQSFLACFHCANSVITSEHLPRLLELLDALERRRIQLPSDAWWRRYGPAWTAIRHDVLPRFTEGEVQAATEETTGDALLDLVEPGWEHL
ncbi:hypothetical protein [Microbacterium aquimaris]|uniref:Integrase n=1 Tax=Microbacterium aquimaris TaxID=459816 RepID=A0ABU5N810_9MICO|nr:hypothetical protein [Microbacterium aquimaris]MDZ8162161.1 hypothetical protein [Microbacterium aquimaris]